MALYKVPQDVEAEDKIVGPFSLKQFIFILLFFASGWFAFILSRIALPFGFIMLPFLIIFGVLGFVMRKDQPVEVYLAALVRFYLKPHKRIWDQEGYEQRVIITAPKIIERRRTKDISQEEVHSRLSRLANVVDSRGWSAKGLNTKPSDRIANPTIAGPNPDADAPDIMDEGTVTAQKFDNLIQQRTQANRQQVVSQIQQAAAASPTPPSQMPAANNKAFNDDVNNLLDSMASTHYNPYPTDIHQTVIKPGGDRAADQAAVVKAATDAAKAVAQPMKPQVSPAIMQLANNNDLTVSAIARHAHSLPTDEVVITLR